MKPLRGYTLIEVLIVVTVIGLASAIVVPHMLDASTLGIQAAARTVIADLLYAQNEAVIHQRPYRVTIDTDAERYWLESDLDRDGDLDPVELQWRVGGGDQLIDFLADDRFRGISIAKATKAGGNYTFTEDNGLIVIEFNELGEPVQGGDTYIGLVAASADQRFVVHVAAFTGRVTVEEVVQAGG